MADSILCPQVGQDLTEAKVVALHVKLGDKVKKGDIVAEVESEKASFEVESFSSGTVIALPYKVGDTATVLEPLVVLGKEGKSVAYEPKKQAAASSP
ncbi:MAG: biotin/lipoyl-binding protein, partial [Alphaproteobacteria bacterium]|nr:biotin/lipoyl-binding protein [Alphaproteobacteria bacterium]